jgi:Lon protease-like protein
MNDAEELPMFPLGSAVLPGAILALQVFEPRYRMMVKAVLANGGEFGVVLIERGHEVGGGEVRFDVGCRVRIVEVEELADGRYALAAVGLEPIDVVEWLPDDPYPRARVAPHHEPRPASEIVASARAALDGKLAQLLALLVERDGSFDPGSLVVPDDPVAAAWAVALALGPGPLDQQRLLEAADVAARMDRLGELIDDRILITRAGMDHD